MSSAEGETTRRDPSPEPISVLADYHSRNRQPNPPPVTISKQPKPQQASDGADNDDTTGSSSDEDTNHSMPLNQRAPFNPRIRRKKANLRTFGGSWANVLTAAKYQYRVYIHTRNPFAMRDPFTLKKAKDCLLEAMAQYQEDSGRKLDMRKFLLFMIPPG